ncbi:hypothetical protein QRD89_10895 [Halobacillus sp. ACCC02827]|uniref:HEAT repeat domain-containing protein n=1 Tax=Halobacillus sp. ACCC02827 TaxID=3052090 RepID=UPI002570BFF9|nr:hypothetical protein [Halobacillus sp. ACCC02827]WJE14234.1 hypothetical protein QRD89_10895 [Halobacillus sp. ACCC02827]
MLQLVFILVGVLFALQVFLLCYLLVMKANRLRIQEHRNDLYAFYYGSFRSFLAGEEEEPEYIMSKTDKVNLIERMLNDIVDRKDPAVSEERVEESAHKHLAQSYQLLLKKGSWSQRVNTLFYIEDFHMTQLKDDVWEHFQSLRKIDEEYRQTVRTAAALGDERVIRVILETPHMTQRLAKQMLRRMPADFLSTLIYLIEEGADTKKDVIIGILTYCGETKNQEHVAFIKGWLQDEDKEIRLKALRSYADADADVEMSVIASFFQSNYWEERMLVARLAGMRRVKESREALHDLTGDREWWVRYTACQAIRQLPAGQDMLARIAEEHPDGFARDMARQFMSMKVRESV